MDVKILIFMLFAFTVHGISIRDTPANGIDVAFNKTTFSDQIKEESNPGYAVDDNLSTCMETKQAVGETMWRVDLGFVHSITGVAMKNSALGLTQVEIYISTDPRGLGEVCKFMTYSPDYEAYIPCASPTAGRYVILKNPRGPINVCEIQVIECRQNFFGVDCSGQCHCLDGAVCNKLTGKCPSACAAGYHGENCSLTCSENKFGPNCARDCHCASQQSCNRVDGLCSAGCAEGWKGSDCQTQVPQLDVEPEIVNADSDSITLSWPSWKGSISTGFEVKYQVEHMEYYSPDKVWKPGVNVTLVRGNANQEATVSKLKLNTRYKFRVRPLLYKDGVFIEAGAYGPASRPFKTKCIVPEAPTIIDLEPGVDNFRDPPRATITVTWERPAKEGIRCDSIAYYKIIFTKLDSGVYEHTKAQHDATSKVITDLDFEADYQVIVVVVNNEEFDGQSRDRRIQTNSLTDVAATAAPTGLNNDQVLVMFGAGVVVFFIIIVIILGVVFYRCNYRGQMIRKKKAKYTTVPPKDLDAPDRGSVSYQLTPLEKTRTPTHDSGILVEPPSKPYSPSSSADSFNQVKDYRGVNNGMLTKAGSPSSPDVPAVAREHFPINIEDLEDYVMQRRDNDCHVLKSEYKEFPEGLQLPCEYGRAKDNKHKNRFINIIPYDHSRVVLNMTEGDVTSDYINANYVDGYGKEKYYIAAQGCNKYTTQDMWRMAWEQNCLRIVMVTNLVENGKRKCEQYWPENMNVAKPYGNLMVTWVDTEQTSDFCIRTFNLKKDEETRQVKQFHFTAWPDHGVPTRAAPIIAFRRKVRSFDDTHPGHTIVHCSAGVGRTGTYIAIDYLLEMAKVEKKIDLYKWTKTMREARMNMIQTEEQYVFVYDALLEALKTGDTAIPCSDFRMEFEALLQPDSDTEEEEEGDEEGGHCEPHSPQGEGKTKLQKQFETLQSISPRILKEDCESGVLPENIEKNRNQDILPADRHRPYLSTQVRGTNDYINAVFLDGYKMRNSHLITQMPLPHTVIDFWRLVHEHNVGSIVMLNPFDPEDESQGQYWPDDLACECGPFVIEPVGVNTDTSDITVCELKLTFQHTSETGQKYGEQKERVVNLFQYQAWNPNEVIPASKTSLMSLVDMVEKSQYKTGNGPVLIHCLDGAWQSGLYAAISCIWEKMKEEQVVDIFYTVKHLRYHRPQVIQNLEQYKFCFEMVLAFLAEYETYANFTWKGNDDSSPESE